MQILRIVGVTFLAVAIGFYLFAKSNGANPSATGTANILVVNDVTGQPISNAWICMTTFYNDNSDGLVESSAAFSGSNGLASVILPSGTEHIDLYVAADLHGSYLTENMRIVSDQWTETFEVRLEPKGASLYWGKLVGVNVGGAKVRAVDTDLEPRAVCGPNGLFALSVAKDTPLEMHAYGDGIRDLFWKMSLSDYGSAQSPNLFPIIDVQRGDVGVALSEESGTDPLTLDAMVLYARMDPGEEKWSGKRSQGSQCFDYA